MQITSETSKILFREHEFILKVVKALEFEVGEINRKEINVVFFEKVVDFIRTSAKGIDLYSLEIMLISCITQRKRIFCLRSLMFVLKMGVFIVILLDKCCMSMMMEEVLSR